MKTGQINVQTENIFPTYCERYNGKGDAFRHAYWNALASQSLGVNTTKLLTTNNAASDGMLMTTSYRILNHRLSTM